MTAIHLGNIGNSFYLKREGVVPPPPPPSTDVYIENGTELVIKEGYTVTGTDQGTGEPFTYNLTKDFVIPDLMDYYFDGDGDKTYVQYYPQLSGTRQVTSITSQRVAAPVPVTVDGVTYTNGSTYTYWNNMMNDIGPHLVDSVQVNNNNNWRYGGGQSWDSNRFEMFELSNFTPGVEYVVPKTVLWWANSSSSSGMQYRKNSTIILSTTQDVTDPSNVIDKQSGLYMLAWSGTYFNNYTGATFTAPANGKIYLSLLIQRDTDSLTANLTPSYYRGEMQKSFSLYDQWAFLSLEGSAYSQDGELMYVDLTVDVKEYTEAEKTLYEYLIKIQSDGSAELMLNPDYVAS